MKAGELSVVLLVSLIPCYTATGPGIIGGPKVLSVDDPQIVELGELVVKSFGERRSNLRTYCLKKILNATRQVVTGSLTQLSLLMGYKSMSKRCQVDIWEESPTGEKEVTTFRCSPIINETHEHHLRENDLEEPANRGIFTNFGKTTNGKAWSSNNGEQQERSEESVPAEQMFNNFAILHNREYSNEEEKKERFDIFTSNLFKIRNLQDSERGTARYGVTKFADLSSSEYRSLLGIQKPLNESTFQDALIPNVKLPSRFDWRKRHAVTPVKDQGKCKSSWAFSVTGNIEGQWALKKGKLLSLSVQELLDCATEDDVCDGGSIPLAYQMIQSLGGLESEKDYPYHGKPEECQFKKNKTVAKISSTTRISRNEVKMAKWLVKNGPISVLVNADPLQHYAGGVAHPSRKECDPEKLNHGALIVGFGVDHIRKKKVPYWIVKNSWGVKWGEKGYYRLYRGDGTCGINRFPTSAVI